MRKFLLSSRARPERNFGCNNYSNLDPSVHSISSAASQFFVATAAVLLVSASAGLACLYAWQSGSKFSVALGGLSVVAALGLKLAEPFCIQGALASFARWRIITGAALLAVGLLAVAFSLQAELQYLSTMRSDAASERDNEASAAQRADKRYDAASAALLALKPASGSRADLRTYEAQRAALQAIMASAEAERRAAPTPRVADPGAAAIAAYATAAGWKADAASIGVWLPAIGTLAIELGAAFSVLLVRSVNPSVPTQQTALAVAQVAHAQNTAETAASVAVAEVAQEAGNPVNVRKRRDDDDDCAGPRPGGKRGVAALLDHVRASGGAVELGQRELARRLGASRTTLQRALADLAASGAVIVDATRYGTRIALT